MKTEPNTFHGSTTGGTPLGLGATLLPRDHSPQSFHESLDEWMSRAPWALISAAFHFVVFLILAAIPWNEFEVEEPPIVSVGSNDPIEDIIEDPIEPPELLEEVVEELDPVLEEIDVSEFDAPADLDTPADAPFATGVADSPFDAPSTGAALGLGAGAGGGGLGGRFGNGGGHRRGYPGDGAVRAGLEWLVQHQDDDGKWDADGFPRHDPEGDKTGGLGDANHDVGVTALAVLAFLGDGHSMTRGNHKRTVRNGIRWLLNEQDAESGLVGDSVSKEFLYGHSIATLALAEAYFIDRSPVVRRGAQNAVSYITTARNSYGVWRYSVPANGQQDTSVTGWMVFALKAARNAGLKTDTGAFADAITWFDQMTDTSTGRCGYTEAGSLSSRVTGLNDHFPREGGEAMTAVSLLSRFFLGQEPENESRMRAHADLMLRALPKWSADGLTNDMYYWYYGSYAMFQMGGRHWKKWERALKPAVIETQRTEGAADGSWDPNGPWGHAGGRVYSTALMVLCAEVYYRYQRVGEAK